MVITEGMPPGFSYYRRESGEYRLRVPKYLGRACEITVGDEAKDIKKQAWAIFNGWQPQVVSVVVNSCARCGADHLIDFKAFRPGLGPEGWSHWGRCRNSNEPVLLSVKEG